MIQDPVSIRELKRSTTDLIEHDPIAIVLKRFAFSRTAAGGQVRGALSNQASKVRHFGSISPDARFTIQQDGEKLEISHVIVGESDDDIREKDEFEVGSRKFRVVEVHPDRSYETRGWVVEYK